MQLYIIFFFFFSSRRRHTRCSRDWSSDVCSSDLSGRNTAIIRANYRTAEGIPFYRESVHLYEEMSVELGWNVLFSQCGHLTLGHTDSAVMGLRVRGETNKLLGVDSELIGPAEIKK